MDWRDGCSREVPGSGCHRHHPDTEPYVSGSRAFRSEIDTSAHRQTLPDPFSSWIVPLAAVMADGNAAIVLVGIFASTFLSGYN